MSLTLSVVSPLYRCRDQSIEFLERLCITLESSELASWNVVLVDDGCPQGSGQFAAECWPGPASAIRVIRLSRNVGQHAALWFGLQEAHGDVVCLLDADLQDRPEDIPTMLSALAPGVDVVAAGRRGRYTGPGRTLTGMGFRAVRTMLTAGRIPADAGMFLVAKKEIVAGLLSLDDPGIHILTGFAQANASIATVPLPRVSRTVGVSAYSSTRRAALAVAALVDCTPAYSLRRLNRIRRRRPVTFDVLSTTHDLGGHIEVPR